MPAITKAIRKANDDEFRREFNREFYGEDIDDYMRRLTGHESYYDEQARLENERYWEDYTKNTGIEPMYPIRVGAQWNQPIGTLPLGLTQLPGKLKAIDMLYGGQR